MPITEKPQIRPDNRITCRQCKNSRPLSLTMTGTCVFCTDNIDAEVPECAAGGKSHMVQCHVRTCHAFYAVERPLKLLCEPRCHYCRNRLPAPLITCKKCRARHVTPGAHNMEAQAANDLVCAMCDTMNEAASKAVEHGVFLPRDSVIVQEAPVGELLLENPGLRAMFKYAVPPETRGLKLSEAIRRFEEQIASQEPQEIVHGLTWRGAAVHNCEHVCDQIREAVCSGEISKLCPLCCCIRQLAAIAPVPACDCNNNVANVSQNKNADPPTDDFSSRINDYLSNSSTSAETARHLTTKVLEQENLEHGLWELWEAFFSAVSRGRSQHESLISLLEAIRAVPTTEPSNTSSSAGPLTSDTQPTTDNPPSWETLPGFGWEWRDTHDALMAWRLGDMGFDPHSDGDKYFIFSAFSAALVASGSDKVESVWGSFACREALEQSGPERWIDKCQQHRTPARALPAEEGWALDVRVASVWMQVAGKSVLQEESPGSEDSWYRGVTSETDDWKGGEPFSRDRWKLWQQRFEDLSKEPSFDLGTKTAAAAAADVVKGFLTKEVG
jgi:hypothetical protein